MLYDILCWLMSWYTSWTKGYATLRYTMPCHAMQLHAIPCHATVTGDDVLDYTILHWIIRYHTGLYEG